MTTKVKNGNHMKVATYTNAGSAISSGDIVVVGSTSDAFLAIALVDIANGASGSVGYDCEVEAAKVSAAVFAQGESLTWDFSASAFDDNQATAASGDVSGGASRAEAAGADAETTCRVWLTGVPSTLTA